MNQTTKDILIMTYQFTGALIFFTACLLVDADISGAFVGIPEKIVISAFLIKKVIFGLAGGLWAALITHFIWEKVKKWKNETFK